MRPRPPSEPGLFAFREGCPPCTIVRGCRRGERAGHSGAGPRRRAARRLRHWTGSSTRPSSSRRPARSCPAPHYAELMAQIAVDGRARLRRAADLANRSFLHRGITFTVYSDDGPGRRADPAVRPDPAHRPGRRVGRRSRPGLRQRIRALNLFVHDVYHEQEILHDGIVPRRLVVLGAPLPARGGRDRRAATTSTCTSSAAT